jgi:hypothetical protein
MTRRERELAERKIGRLIESDGDNCSLCRAPFIHNAKSYCGVSHDGIAAITGECCASKLRHVLGAGFYVDKTRRYDFLEKTSPSQKEPRTAQEIAEAINAYQTCIEEADRFRAETVKRGGMPLSSKGTVYMMDTPWKDNDREWFEDHPDRSHRLRSRFDEELPPDVENCPPPGHEQQTLVRQLEPGKRIRVFFHRNVNVEIPDVESVIRALFDLVASREIPPGGMIALRDAAALAMNFEAAEGKLH